MNSVSELPTAGYRLGRVYTIEQRYCMVDRERVPNQPAEREIRYGWDWRVTGPRAFEVLVSLDLGPTLETPDEASVKLVGAFTADEGVLSVPFHAFVRVHAPAMLFAYVRESLSSLTGRGPFGPYMVPALNLKVMMERFSEQATVGARQLQSDSQLAQAFGLDPRHEAVRQLPDSTRSGD